MNDAQSMPSERWTWDPCEHPKVLDVVSTTVGELEWCGQLESAAADAVTGKVLCVCVAAAIAREVLARQVDDTQSAAAALGLLDAWIDQPTEERFERICHLIFKDESQDFGPHGVAWSAFRTATSSVGNSEVGWALESTCRAASNAGMSPDQMREIAIRELLSRASR